MADPNQTIGAVVGGRVLDPAGQHDGVADVTIAGGKVVNVGAKPGTMSGRVLDAKGLWVLPGLVDLHVHLREPGGSRKETIKSGLEAAVRGGFTSVACMANTEPVNDSPPVTAWILARACEAALARVYPIGAVSKGLKGEELAPLASLVAEGVRAISDDGRPVTNSRLMRQAMELARGLGVPVISHAEDLWLSEGTDMHEGATSLSLGLRGNPAASEEIMVARELALCRLTGCRTHIAHVSTKRAVDLIRAAKSEGLAVSAEVSPHHLIFTDVACAGLNACHKMAPPLRSESDRLACIEGLAEGTIDCIASDHAPHGAIDKQVPWPEAACGVIGLETSMAATLALVHEGAVPLQRWVEAMTSAPSAVLSLPHGSLKQGQAADLTLIDPECSWTYRSQEGASASHNSPFEGQTFRGAVVATLVGGRLVYDGYARRTRS